MENKVLESLEKVELELFEFETRTQHCEEEINTIKQALTTKSKKEQAFDIMKKYAANDGWSNGWVIKFWDMNSEELDLVNEVLKND